MKTEVDLFVCPHVQGDPSCTYLEVLACGVPIAGFANEAFAGILERAPVGWGEPIGEVKKLAATIAGLAQNRGRLERASREAAEFAKNHLFETTMRARIDHVRRCASPRL